LARVDLTQGPVSGALLRLAVPMTVGILAVFGFNLADTLFVSRLGTDQLAAISFTFPVVMVLMGVSFALSTGTASVVSRAIGSGNEVLVKRLASDSLSLSFLTVLVVAIAGMLTIDPLFTALGAGPDLLPLIRDYMLIWYPGVAVLVIPIVANASIQAGGDTRFPAAMMVVDMLMNVILDPILIFGWFGLPRLELQGAAIATVISRATICSTSARPSCGRCWPPGARSATSPSPWQAPTSCSLWPWVSSPAWSLISAPPPSPPGAQASVSPLLSWCTSLPSARRSCPWWDRTGAPAASIVPGRRVTRASSSLSYGVW